jgi:hypothetical protein
VQREGQGCIRVDPPRTTITFTRLLPNTTSSSPTAAPTREM